MKAKRFTLPLLLCLLTLSSSCKKEEGIGGEASIKGYVKHHDDAIPNADVYIKYGATELPGMAAGDFDAETKATANDAYFEFTKLQRGDYYLFAIGYDSACACEVIGGVSIQIVEKTETVESNIPITE